MFFQFILAMLLGFACPNHNNTTNNGNTVAARDFTNPADTGGDTTQIPPKK